MIKYDSKKAKEWANQEKQKVGKETIDVTLQDGTKAKKTLKEVKEVLDSDDNVVGIEKHYD